MTNKNMIIENQLTERIKLLMGYDVSMTLSENKFNLKEQEKKISISSSDKVSGYEPILSIDNKALLVPKGTKILEKADTAYYLTMMSSKSLSSWRDKKKGGDGNEKTDLWIPGLEEWPYIATPDSVVKFQTPNGDTYSAMYSVKGPVSQISDWESFYKLEPDPLAWQGWYYRIGDKKPYEQPKADNPWYMDVLYWIKDNWSIVAQIAVSIIAGILSGGLTLMTQALIQLGIDLTFALKELLIDKDAWGATVSFIIGLVPVAGRLGKYGVNDVVKFLKKEGEVLSKIKTPAEFEEYFLKLSDADKLLVTRAFKQTPAELKKAMGIAGVNSLKEGLKTGTIVLSKIPTKQLLWWKQLFIEGGVAFGTGVGLELAKAFWQMKQVMKELQEKGITLSADEETEFGLEELEKKYNIKAPECDTPEKQQEAINLLKEEDPF
jgi:hypothetical protein